MTKLLSLSGRGKDGGDDGDEERDFRFPTELSGENGVSEQRKGETEESRRIVFKMRYCEEPGMQSHSGWFGGFVFLLQGCQVLRFAIGTLNTYLFMCLPFSVSQLLLIQDLAVSL